MGNKLRGKDLIAIGYPEGKVISIALNAIERCGKKQTNEEKLELLALVLENPAEYLEHEHLAIVAETLTPPAPTAEEIKLLGYRSYPIYGIEGIDYEARRQMDLAMQLPIAISGALMPDAHVGYGLPIGGVLATDNAVIPFGVGVDIGCRMCLSLYPIDPSFIDRNREQLKRMLLENTRFGSDAFDRPKDDSVLSRSEFREIPVVKKMHGKAMSQIGSSGSGNHFVEFGIAHITDAANEMKVAPGQYLAVLSHSGSRGLGAAIAGHYTDLAMKVNKLPKGAQHLAWLSLDTQEGMEYWLAMNLAGDYASACHHHIHARLSKALGERPLAMVENHHNFAWKETLANGKEAVVHRKGATPAGKGVLGIIPGSMTAPGFIVRGTGDALSLASASHGAGRLLSRSQAKSTLNKREMAQFLEKHGVELLGGGVDEAPMAYKDIQQVMASQTALVEVLGTFTPKIVRMSGD